MRRINYILTANYSANYGDLPVAGVVELRFRVTLELVPNKNYDLQQVFFKEDNLFVIIVNTYNQTEEAVE